MLELRSSQIRYYVISNTCGAKLLNREIILFGVLHTILDALQCSFLTPSFLVPSLAEKLGIIFRKHKFRLPSLPFAQQGSFPYLPNNFWQRFFICFGFSLGPNYQKNIVLQFSYLARSLVFFEKLAFYSEDHWYKVTVKNKFPEKYTIERAR